MKKFSALIVCIALYAPLSFAENAFTIHTSLQSPVHIYYDTKTIKNHIVLSIYPHYEFRMMSDSELSDWKNEGFPICGAMITLLSEAGNNTFYVRVGTDAESIYGYIKRGTIAVITRNYDRPLYLYQSDSYESEKKEACNGSTYARIMGKKGSWFYVFCKNEKGELIRGWLPWEMRCSSFLTVCP